MNLALDKFADNPIIDELVFWPPKPSRIKTVRACNVLFRQPFIEVKFAQGEIFQRHFARDSFVNHWAEACVILDTITTIELIPEFDSVPFSDREKFVQTILSTREQCIEESYPMFDQGLYAQFLMQFGADCKNLPEQCQQRISRARHALETTP